MQLIHPTQGTTRIRSMSYKNESNNFKKNSKSHKKICVAQNTINIHYQLKSNSTNLLLLKLLRNKLSKCLIIKHHLDHPMLFITMITHRWWQRIISIRNSQIHLHTRLARLSCRIQARLVKLTGLHKYQPQNQKINLLISLQKMHIFLVR